MGQGLLKDGAAIITGAARGIARAVVFKMIDEARGYWLIHLARYLMPLTLIQE
jgi:short-subunit dehydrogenase